MDLPRPSTPVQISRGFQVKHRAFSFRGIPRATPSKLNWLFHPDSQRLKRDQKAAHEEAKRTIKRDWLTAQLKLYGISFRNGATKSELETSLKTAVDSGKCENVPDDIQRLENDLQARYQEPYERFEAELSQWQQDIDKAKNDKYQQQPTLSAKAEFDLERFMKEFFLDVRGEPDLRKTAQPIALPGVSRAQVHARAERVPGLVTVSGGSGEDRTLVIGWDRNAVFKKASSVGRETAERVQAQRSNSWELKMAKHRQYPSKLAEMNPDQEWYEGNCRGDYAIKCTDVESGWHCDASKFRLRIAMLNDWDLVGQFDFGVVKGVMHLATDATTIPHSEGKRSRADRDDSEEDGDSEESDDSEEDEDSISESDDSFGNENFANVDSRKRKASGELRAYSIHSAKHSKQPSRGPGSRRVHFVWRGRETGEGQIQNGKDLVGYMDFQDDAGSSFKGRILIPFSGNAEFEGYNVGGMIGPIRDTWEDYSDKQYEYERVARWR